MQRPWGSKELGSQGSERVRVKGQRVSGEGGVWNFHYLHEERAPS